MGVTVPDVADALRRAVGDEAWAAVPASVRKRIVFHVFATYVRGSLS